MTDIVERLRARIRHFDEASLLHEFLHYLKSDAALDKEAANEIERLKARPADELLLEENTLMRAALRKQSDEIERLQAIVSQDAEVMRALLAQLPDDMKHCTIVFKECSKGHSRLIATNWIDHGCQQCEIERLTAEHDDYVIRANANVCELNREIERLRASIDTLIRERDAERRAYNGAITGHLAENEQLRVALEIIAGRRQCLDNLMGNVDVACAALDGKRP